ncbi:formyl-CoA transferase [Amycolatopsis sp. A1MSW2902]|uniref:CaiB/BaiF CoA transferase family protein n=1 Tax=Amycolatopsis sp. A1MSW2902 TaxID=687413 RepID=UPI00307E96B9
MQHKPLSGIRVLEIGGYISMPYGGAVLSALGADVVKVEKTGDGDDFRRHLDDKSPFFVQYNAGKRSLSVDLKKPEGVEIVKALIPHYDVALENMRPGKMAALGLGPDVCAKLNPNLVYGSITGFGDGGPLRDRPAYDTIGQSFGGIYSILGDAGRAQLSGTILVDLITGLTTAMGVLAALVGRANLGGGQRLETSLMEAVSTLTVDAMTQSFETGQDPSRESRHPQAQNFCLHTASGEDIAVHLSSSQKFWQHLCDAMGKPELKQDPRFSLFAERQRNYFELVPIVEAVFKEKTADEWAQILTEHDVPFAPVLTMSGYAKHPQVDWLELFEPGPDGISLLRPPWRFGGVRPDRGGSAPRIGENSREVLAEVYDNARIEELIASGVVVAS